MEFTWDETKNRTNIEKYGIDFEQAKIVFEDPDLLNYEDGRFEYGEAREISIGLMPLVTQGKIILVVVVHTSRNGVT